MKRIILILFFISFFSFSGEVEMIAYMKKNNSRLSEKEARDIYKSVVQYSAEYDFDPILVFSVMKTESNFRHSTVSTAGAKGLMQLMPENFEEFGVDNSIKGNIKGGIKHLKRDYDDTQDVTKTLVCYNAGCARLQNNEWKRISETRNYVRKINDIYPEIRNMYYANVENSISSAGLVKGFSIAGNYKMLETMKNENFFENKEYLHRKESYIWKEAVRIIYIAAILLSILLILGYFIKNIQNTESDKEKKERIKLQNQRMKMIEKSILRQQKEIKKNIIAKRYWKKVYTGRRVFRFLRKCTKFNKLTDRDFSFLFFLLQTKSYKFWLCLITYNPKINRV